MYSPANVLHQPRPPRLTRTTRNPSRLQDSCQGLTGLRSLTLSGTEVTDAGLARLKGLAALETLDLNFNDITDAGLVHLEGLAALKELHLIDTKVSDAGVAKLKAALPKCRIRH